MQAKAVGKVFGAGIERDHAQFARGVAKGGQFCLPIAATKTDALRAGTDVTAKVSDVVI